MCNVLLRYLRHVLTCSGSLYNLRHSVMRSPIFSRQVRVCCSCSCTDSPSSGLSNCFRAFFTGLIRSLHCIHITHYQHNLCTLRLVKEMKWNEENWILTLTMLNVSWSSSSSSSPIGTGSLPAVMCTGPWAFFPFPPGLAWKCEKLRSTLTHDITLLFTDLVWSNLD